jgi:hypothetical protein
MVIMIEVTQIHYSTEGGKRERGCIQDDDNVLALENLKMKSTK